RACSVHSVVNQKTDQCDEHTEEGPGLRARPLYPSGIRSCIGKLPGKNQEAQTRQNRRSGKIEKSLQEVDPKHPSSRKMVFARQQEWADRFAGAPQHKDRGKTHYRAVERIPEGCG